MDYSKAALLPALLCASTLASAAEPAGFDQLREQLQALGERLDALEQENHSLAAENARLRAPAVVNTPVPAAAPGWTDRVRMNADLRLRHDQIMPPGTVERIQHRARARVGFELEATDAVRLGLQLASGGDNPRSGNQTFGGVQTRKSIGLDLAFLEWRPTDAVVMTAGKMRYPFVRPGQSLFFDGDPNPEGAALAFSSGNWFGSAWGFWLDERAADDDAMMVGGQWGWKGTVGESRLLAAFQYYDLGGVQGRRTFYGCSGSAAIANRTMACANGNTVIGTNASDAVLVHDFRIAEVLTELNLSIGDLPLQLWGDYARNLDPDDLNVAYGLGFTLGKASRPRHWELGAAWHSTEKDALFGQFIDGEFADGRTDSQGWVLRVNYAAARNVVLGTTWFINEQNVDVGTPLDYERLFLDVVVKF